ncbi:hypothetical protein BJ742DRAFT_46551 [Cladochytrium replicatum]|nr:hypothetical protein BJ742DRAFT_46551 [Cladochytrium replicatum]
MAPNPAPKNEDYSKQEYWEERYKDPAEQEGVYEWCGSWPNLRETISPYLKIEDCIIHLGCGNSIMSIEMCIDGFPHHINIDYAPAVITAMSNRYSAAHPTVFWKTADIFKLNADDLFDEKNGPAPQITVAIDKASLDAFLTKFKAVDDPWDPSEESLEIARRYLEAAAGVLQERALLIHISWEQPHFRRRFLEIGGYFKVEKVHEVDIGLGYFVFICRKT